MIATPPCIIILQETPENHPIIDWTSVASAPTRFDKFGSRLSSDCVFTVQKPYVIELSGLTSSEKQIPRNC